MGSLMVVIYTCIDGINIPVQPGPLTSVFFSGDCEDPPGFYEFWTMQNKEGSLTGRWPAGSDPGERFRQEDARALAQTAVRLRPSSAQEVEVWLNDPSHVPDAPCAQHGELNGQQIRIGRDPVDAHYIVQASDSPTEPSPS
jgi:hypothetical protein